MKNNIQCKRPPFLNIGDKISIVATARSISKEELEPAINILTNWGLEVVLGDNIFKIDNQFAGTDAERTADLQAMLNNSSIKAILIARGGYGTMRIIDKLDFSRFISAPKWIIGYSDITILHTHIHNLGVETLHATMPINFIKDAESTETLKKALFGELLNYQLPTHPLNKQGIAQGQLIGGNLSLLNAITGSESDIDTKGKILFIEDLDEYLYHIDRMFLHLKRAGKLSQLAGLIVGGMSDMKDNNIPFGKNAEEIIASTLSEYNYPICFGFPAGHTKKNFALFFGKEITLQVAQERSLVF